MVELMQPSELDKELETKQSTSCQSSGIGKELDIVTTHESFLDEDIADILEDDTPFPTVWKKHTFEKRLHPDTIQDNFKNYTQRSNSAWSVRNNKFTKLLIKVIRQRNAYCKFAPSSACLVNKNGYKASFTCNYTSCRLKAHVLINHSGYVFLDFVRNKNVPHPKTVTSKVIDVVNFVPHERCLEDAVLPVVTVPQHHELVHALSKEILQRDFEAHVVDKPSFFGRQRKSLSSAACIDTLKPLINKINPYCDFNRLYTDDIRYSTFYQEGKKRFGVHLKCAFDCGIKLIATIYKSGTVKLRFIQGKLSNEMDKGSQEECEDVDYIKLDHHSKNLRINHSQSNNVLKIPKVKVLEEPLDQQVIKEYFVKNLHTLACGKMQMKNSNYTLPLIELIEKHLPRCNLKSKGCVFTKKAKVYIADFLCRRDDCDIYVHAYVQASNGIVTLKTHNHMDKFNQHDFAFVSHPAQDDKTMKRYVRLPERLSIYKEVGGMTERQCRKYMKDKKLAKGTFKKIRYEAKKLEIMKSLKDKMMEKDIVRELMHEKLVEAKEDIDTEEITNEETGFTIRNLVKITKHCNAKCNPYSDDKFLDILCDQILKDKLNDKSNVDTMDTIE